MQSKPQMDIEGMAQGEEKDAKKGTCTDETHRKTVARNHSYITHGTFVHALPCVERTPSIQALTRATPIADSFRRGHKPCVDLTSAAVFFHGPRSITNFPCPSTAGWFSSAWSMTRPRRHVLGARVFSVAVRCGVKFHVRQVSVGADGMDGGARAAAAAMARHARLARPMRRVKAAAAPTLVGMSQEELGDLAEAIGERRYRGKQMFDALYTRKLKRVEEFVQLSKGAREKLKGLGVETGRAEVFHAARSTDGTVKLLLKLQDGRVVETVGIPSNYSSKSRLTVCVSSQVGCPMKCTFCATGKGGFARNLSASEIVDQVLAIEEEFGIRVTNVVFMGMGEPLLNLSAVIKAQQCLNQNVGIGQRNITISSVGVPNAIRKLAMEKLQSTLAVSLHAPNQALREKLIPSAKTYPLYALMEDCTAYFEITGRRVTFEYTLLSGVNDLPEHAEELAKLLYKHNLASHVNLIPYNPVDESDYQRPTRQSITLFEEALKKRKVPVSVRVTRGMDASAACGQLRNEFQKEPMLEAAESTPSEGGGWQAASV